MSSEHSSPTSLFRRWRRPLLRLGAVASLLVCTTVTVIWVRSYFAVDEWILDKREATQYHAHIQQYIIFTDCGQFSFTCATLDSTNPGCIRETKEGEPRSFYHFVYYRSSPPTLWDQIGFSWGRGHDSDDRWQSADSRAGIPAWLLVILSGAMPFFWAKKYIAMRHKARLMNEGRCQRRGYNLIGNSSGICPECGTPAPQF